MSAEQKAIPVPDEWTKPYWDAAKEHRFALQRCATCGLWNATPRVICPKCHGSAFEWAEPSGKGTIHSYVIVHQTTQPGFTDEIPFVIVVAQLDEEPTCYVTANLLVGEDQFDKLNINLPVKVTFEDRGAVTVPQFMLA